jgi:MYXO-CTERM domain-containing protein
MMKSFKKIIGLLSRVSTPGIFALAALALAAVPARAAVNLSLATTGGASSVTLPHGGSFSVTLNLTSSAESLTGVDYYFNISGGASGLVRLTGRDLTGSSFSDPNLVNSGDNASSPGVLDANFSLLNPQNSLDLGATLTNVGVALPANTGGNPASYLLGTYTFNVDPSAPAGSYILSTTSLPGSGVVTQAPNFSEQSFSQQASFTIVVSPLVGSGVPEPTGAMALIGLGGLFLRRRIR